MAEELLLAQHRNLPGEWRSTQMIVRLGLRLLIIAAFASFGSIGFARGFAALPWMSTILCAVVGTSSTSGRSTSPSTIGTRRRPMPRCFASRAPFRPEPPHGRIPWQQARSRPGRPGTASLRFI